MDGKKSKLQVAIEMGLQPLGEAIINDDFSTILLLVNSFSRDGANPEEIREGGIAIAAEIIFQNYNQVNKIFILDCKNELEQIVNFHISGSRWPNV